jgi:hypothetical protein
MYRTFNIACGIAYKTTRRTSSTVRVAMNVKTRIRNVLAFQNRIAHRSSNLAACGRTPGDVRSTSTSVLGPFTPRHLQAIASPKTCCPSLPPFHLHRSAPHHTRSHLVARRRPQARERAAQARPRQPDRHGGQDHRVRSAELECVHPVALCSAPAQICQPRSQRGH